MVSKSMGCSTCSCAHRHDGQSPVAQAASCGGGKREITRHRIPIVNAVRPPREPAHEPDHPASQRKHGNRATRQHGTRKHNAARNTQHANMPHTQHAAHNTQHGNTQTRSTQSRKHGNTATHKHGNTATRSTPRNAQRATHLVVFPRARVHLLAHWPREEPVPADRAPRTKLLLVRAVTFNAVHHCTVINFGSWAMNASRSNVLVEPLQLAQHVARHRC